MIPGPLCGHLCGHTLESRRLGVANLLRDMVGAAGLEPATSCV